MGTVIPRRRDGYFRRSEHLITGSIAGRKTFFTAIHISVLHMSITSGSIFPRVPSHRRNSVH